MSTTIRKYSMLFGVMAAAGLLPVAFAQGGPTVLSLAPLPAVTAKAGTAGQSTLSITVATGYHANSNKPADSYLIPLTLTWNPGPLEAIAVVFPKPQIQKLGFSAKPVSVFTGNFDIVTRFKIAGDAAPGKVAVQGKLHYQACDDRSCLPPKTLEVSLPLEIVK